MWASSEAAPETKIQVHVFYMGGDPGCPAKEVPTWDGERESTE